jgi:hypothetical protein
VVCELERARWKAFGATKARTFVKVMMVTHEVNRTRKHSGPGTGPTLGASPH